LITHIVHIPDPRLKFFKLKKKFTLLIFAQWLRPNANIKLL
jgi:hypothetical protein